MWRGGDAEQLLPSGHGWVVDSLDVDVVPAHHDVTDLIVLLRIGHLSNPHTPVSQRQWRSRWIFLAFFLFYPFIKLKRIPEDKHAS